MPINKRDDLIRFYHNLGCTQFEIIAFLSVIDNISISGRQLKRILRRLQLRRRKQFSDIDNVLHFIENELRGSSQLHGYRWMHLKCIQSGLTVTQETVRSLLNIIDPIGVEVRRRRRLRRRVYYNKGPNYVWHVDGYDKLKRYGIAISGCIDGYSRYMVWLKAAYSNNNPRIISGYYINAVHFCGGCPQTIRSDMGTENGIMEHMQLLLHHNVRQGAMPAFVYGKSVHNQRIEGWWSILRKHNSQFWMDLFEELNNDGLFDGNYLDKSLIQFCFMDLIQKELDEMSLEWNSHTISRSRNQRCPTGKPIVMYNMPQLYGTEDYLLNVSEIDILTFKEECIFPDLPCDEDVYELFSILMNENVYEMPTTPNEGVQLYVNLRRIILQLLEY